MLKKLWKWLDKNPWLVWILFLTIVLRIPSLYEPNWYGDEGIYLVLGQAIRKGLVIYRDIHDNKPPLLYLLAGLAGKVFYFRLILMIWFGAAVAGFYKLMQVLFPKKKAAWQLSTLAMIGLTTIFEGNVANAEIFIVLPVTLGMLMAYENYKNRVKKFNWRLWLGIGLIFNLGFMLKVPAGLDFGALMIWLIFFSKFDKKAWLMIAGFLLPTVLSLVYFYFKGGFEPYWRSALMQNFGYLASWKTGEHSLSGFSSQNGLMIRTGLLILSLGGFWLTAKKYQLSQGARLTVVWFLLALFGGLLSERPYPHYLIQPAVPLAILFSYFLFGKRKLLKMIILIVAAGTGWFYYQFRFWQYPVVAYYQNFIEMVLNKKSQEEYRNFFDPRVDQNYKVAKYLRAKTLTEDRVFVWGDEPAIYALANRLPVGRYTVAYHVIDFNGFEETMKAFDTYRPKVVVMVEYEKREFPELQARLATDYVLVDKLGQALIYRRVL